MSRVNQTSLIKAIIDGAEKAHAFYEECSGGRWLWESAEYLINVFVAQEINAIDGAKYCTLETNVHQTLKDAQAVKRGPLKKELRHNGRFDLVVWWGNGKPRAAMEFKNQVHSYNNISKDIERIRAVVQNNPSSSSFEFGTIVFYTSCDKSSRNSAEDKIKNRIDLLHKRAESSVFKDTSVTLHHGEVHVEDESAWIFVCMVLKKLRNE